MTAASPRYDVAIIGAGVVGCAVFRELALHSVRCVLLERSADILDGASKGNSAILHTGFDAPPGSLELRLMQAGRRRYLADRDQFGLPILRTDAVLVAWTQAELARLQPIRDKAHRNGVTGVAPLDSAQLLARFPRLSTAAQGALLVPGEDIIDPWSSPLAYALQGIALGGQVLRQFEVTAATRQNGAWQLAGAGQQITARVVINCAGNYGDLVEALARPSRFAIRPRKGQFVVFDKSAAQHVPTILLPVPTERTKGVVICPTIFGNVLVGPTAEDQDHRSDASVDRAALQNLITQAARMVPALAAEPVTATYAGLRPASDRDDYIVEVQPDQWITVAGIRSTGLTAALGIAEHVRDLLADTGQALIPVTDPVWPVLPNLAEHCPRDHQRPGRGDLICLCELVTRDEVEAALSGPLPAGNLGGLKRRTRALMGRCQGCNCLAAVCALAEGRLSDPPPLTAGMHHAR